MKIIAHPNGKQIIVDTFQIEDATMIAKVDILMYNKIKQDGTVLQSLVYVSEPKEVTDTSPIIYDPTDLLTNITLPNKFGANGYGWTEVAQYTTRYDFRKMASAGPVEHDWYDSEDYAPTLGNDELMYDGWYTLQSRGVPEAINLNKLEWGYATNIGDVIYITDDSGTYSSIYSIDDETVKVYGINTFNGTYRSDDFFVFNHAAAMYVDLLDKAMDKEWFTQILSIKPKVRSIESAIEMEKYPVAQYIIQSMDYSLITQLI